MIVSCSKTEEENLVTANGGTNAFEETNLTRFLQLYESLL